MRDMTIGQLRELLSEFDDDTTIRLAFQPSWPLQYHVDDDVRVVRGIVYLREGGQVYDAPYAPRAVFGDPEREPCDSCGDPAIGDIVLDGKSEPTCGSCLEDLEPEIRATFSPYR